MSETLALRPEIVNAETPLGDVKVEASLSIIERIYHVAGVRKAIILVALAALWQAYGLWLGNPLLFPTFTDTLSAFFENIANGVIPARTLV
ncbi:MAG: ABC transporter permease, partial [Bradyrhizobium sp.]|nr:ABC transporter permease [Bradyrhizobium sp.]